MQKSDQSDAQLHGPFTEQDADVITKLGEAGYVPVQLNREQRRRRNKRERQNRKAGRRQTR